jgi:hypothetical protein
MKYMIEFELPDNDTVLREIKTADVAWGIWGYRGYTKAKPVQRWIPCSERLPERYDNYLITTGEGDTDIGTFSQEFKRWYICDADGFKRAEYVLAWCQLPEPYKEGT